MTARRVIGAGGTLPWHYPADLKRFKKLTIGTTVIMGRLTWESLPKKPLPRRRNIVITSRALAGVECFADIPSALAVCEGDVWLIGGEQIFRTGLAYADLIDLTLVPDEIRAPDAVFFPEIDEAVWEAGPVQVHEGNPELGHMVFGRRAQ